jgi:aspartyl-tRNA(Asn)/glutamyl-tRNA(Gln) amidotransferase subunit A
MTYNSEPITTLAERRAAMMSGSFNFADYAGELHDRAMAASNLNAFITLHSKVDVAAAAQRVAASASKLSLAGVVLAVKDNIALTDVRLSCASRILDGYVSPYTATALQRLLDAGVVVIGKTNLDEFAMGSSGENSAFGPTRNPHDWERVTGGSSSGSAAAVAAGIATAALGSDTGGSVRQPAAFCGLVGLKPTYGRVSRYGLTAFGSSLDQIGVLARTTDEAARVFQVMAGHDRHDNTSSPAPAPDCIAALQRGVKGLRVGMPVEYTGEGIQPEVARAVQAAAQALREGGATVEPASLPHTRYAIPTYYIISSAEASSNLARYDGVRYGPRPAGGVDIIRRARQEGFGAEVRRRILLGTYVLSAGYYEAYYLKAQRVRRLIREDFVKAFKQFDLLLTPTTPTTAFKIGEKSADPLAMYLSDVFTVTANLAGVPSVSAPFGKDENGLPVGVQLMGGDFKEDVLFAATEFIQKVIT